jgi:hypothetical protein
LIGSEKRGTTGAAGTTGTTGYSRRSRYNRYNGHNGYNRRNRYSRYNRYNGKTEEAVKTGEPDKTETFQHSLIENRGNRASHRISVFTHLQQRNWGGKPTVARAIADKKWNPEIEAKLTIVNPCARIVNSFTWRSWGNWHDSLEQNHDVV